MLNKCGGAAKLSQTALNTRKRSVKFYRNNRFHFSLSARPSGTTSWYIKVTQTGNSTGLVAMGVKRCYRRHNKRLCYNINNAAATEAVIFHDCRLHDMFGRTSTSVLRSFLLW